MQLLTQWKGVSAYLLRDPATFYDHYDEVHGLGYPFLYLVLSSVVVVLPVTLIAVALNASTPTAAVGAAGAVLVLGAILALLTVLEAVVAHAVLALFGADGVSRSLEAYAFAFPIRYSLWWIPIVNVFPHFYGLYLQVRGLAKFHDVSEAGAAVAVVLGAFSPILVLLAIAAFAAFVLGLGSSVGTPPIAALPF